MMSFHPDTSALRNGSRSDQKKVHTLSQKDSLLTNRKSSMEWRGVSPSRRHPQEEVRMQDLVSHNNVRCGAEAGESSARKSGKGADQGDRLGKRQEKGRTGSVPIVSDGNSHLSTFTQRLLKTWRSRRQSVSEPTRRKRESELTPSMSRAKREIFFCTHGST